MMRILLGGGVLGLALTAACSFPAPDTIDAPPADAPIDAPTDAAPACAADSIVCDDALGVYTDCASDGSIELQIQCPLGCATDVEKCLDIDPSNGLAMYLDMVDGPPDLEMQGSTVIDTRNGTILVGGEGITVPTMLVNGIRVFVVRSLTLDGTAVVLRDRLAPPLAFVSHGDVLIRGSLDISAEGSVPGAGGFGGGEQDETAPCQGGWSGGQGAPGAGGAEPGGAGGQTMGLSGLPGAPAAPSVEPLRGGCDGGNVFGAASTYSLGGGGGGGLQITSRTRIDLLQAGAIDASGGGATHQAASVDYSGGGGGGGGNVILEAPQVVLDGASVVISTKGGGGAGAGRFPGQSGADGGTEPGRAAGGASPEQQAGGGAGGDGITGPGDGADHVCSNCKAGGGGGGAGIAVFRTTAAAIAPQNGASIRSKAMTLQLRTRHLP